jgi:hypothetical protein
VTGLRLLKGFLKHANRAFIFTGHQLGWHFRLMSEVEDPLPVDPFDAVQKAWSARDDLAMRQALFLLLRATIEVPAYTPALEKGLQLASDQVKDRALRQIRGEELLVELKEDRSTVSLIWMNFWLEHAQPVRLAALAEAWLKHRARLVQSDAAIRVALRLAMALSLHRNKLAHQLAESASSPGSAGPDIYPDSLDALLLIGRHMHSAPQVEKTFWTEALVLQRNFNWPSKQPQAHLRKLARMPSREALVPLLEPLLPGEVFRPDKTGDNVSIGMEPRRKRKHRKRERPTDPGDPIGRQDGPGVDEAEAMAPRRRVFVQILAALGGLAVIGLLAFLLVWLP